MFCDKSVVVFVSKMFTYLGNVNVWLQRVACAIISSIDSLSQSQYSILIKILDICRAVLWFIDRIILVVISYIRANC